MTGSGVNLNQVPYISFGLRSDIVSHLERLIKKLDSTELYLNEKRESGGRYLKVSDIAVEPMVVTEDLIPTPSRPNREEQEEMERQPSGDVLAVMLAENYERPVEAEKYRQERDRRLREEFRCQMISF